MKEPCKKCLHIPCCCVKYTVKMVKDGLPNVVIKWNGSRWLARVSGRLNEFASVSPYVNMDSEKRQAAILGPIFHYSWEALARHLNTNRPLQT